MNENKVIATIASSREAFNKLASFIETKTFSDLGQLLYIAITKYYAADKDAVKVDVEVIGEKLKTKVGKNYDMLNEYIQSLPEPTSVPNLLELFNEHIKERKGLEIVHALTSNKDTHAVKLMEEFLAIDVTDQEDNIYNATPLDVLEQHFIGTNLIPIYPTKLNQLLGGGVPRQYQICIFARPNIGKSTAAINIAAGAARNGYQVLYVGNEDPAPVMVYRLVSRLIGISEHEIKKNLNKYYEEALLHGYKNIFLAPLHPGNLQEVRVLVEKYKPDIVIIDQIRNMNIKPESMTINLEQGVIGMRNLAKEFNFVSVVVTQAGESAAHKLILSQEDVEWSNTGVAGQMDLMIGMSTNDDLERGGKVMLSFPKRKYGPKIQPFHAKIDYTTNTILA